MLVLRLSRTGRRNQPKFRLVVAEDRSKLTGKPVAVLGHYQPTDKDKPLVMDREAVAMWLARGVQPSNTMAKILNGQGFDLKVHQYQAAKPKKAPKEEAPVAAAPVAEAGEASEEPAAAPVAEETSEPAAEAVSEEAAAEEAPAEEVAAAPAEEAPADMTEEAPAEAESTSEESEA